MKKFGIGRIIGVILAVVLCASVSFACGEDEQEYSPPTQGSNEFEDTSAAIVTLKGAGDTYINANSFLTLTDGFDLAAVTLDSEQAQDSIIQSNLDMEKVPLESIGRLNVLQEVIDLLFLRIRLELDENGGSIAVLNRWMNYHVPEGAEDFRNKNDWYRLDYASTEEQIKASYTHINTARSKDRIHHLSITRNIQDGVPFTSEISVQIDDSFVVYKRNEIISVFNNSKLYELTLTSVEDKKTLAYYEFDWDDLVKEERQGQTVTFRPERITHLIYGSFSDGFIVVDESSAYNGARVQYFKDGYLIAEYTNRYDMYVNLYAIKNWQNLSLNDQRIVRASLGEDYMDTESVAVEKSFSHFYNPSELKILDSNSTQQELDEYVWSQNGVSISFKNVSGLLFESESLIGTDRADEFEIRKTLLESALNEIGLEWDDERVGDLKSVLDRLRLNVSISTSAQNSGYRLLSYSGNGYATKTFLAFGITGVSDDIEVLPVRPKFDERAEALRPFSTTDISEMDFNSDSVSRWDYAGVITERADHFLGFNASFDSQLAVSLPESEKASLELMRLGEGFNGLKYVLCLERTGSQGGTIPLKSISASVQGGITFYMTVEELATVAISEGSYYLSVRLIGEGTTDKVLGMRVFNSIDSSMKGRSFSVSDEGMTIMYFGNNINTSTFITKIIL